jgi:DNA transformation protein
MRNTDGFRSFVLDQLASLSALTARPMFGGLGIYSGAVFFGIVASDVLYFKVDDSNRDDYRAYGSGPFRPFADKPMSMSYYEVPLEILEDREAIVRWAKRAYAVAAKPKK